MLWNFIKISFRNIRRHKLFSVINIAGLTLSITICLAVLMIVKNQLDFDTFHPEADRTYRVITEVLYENGGTERFSTSPLPLAERLGSGYPFLEAAVPVYGGRVAMDAIANGKKLDGYPAYSTPAFFELFGFSLARGNPATALSEPYSVVLTPETARRYFGDEDPIGREFNTQDAGTFIVTGVLDRGLDHTHLSFDWLASYSTLPNRPENGFRHGVENDWSSLESGRIYVHLGNEADRGQLDAVLSALSDEVARNYELEQNANRYGFQPQPLGAVAPGEFLRNEMVGADIRSTGELLFFAGIALVILLMACFNYTNLSIARALKRSREVGIYKLFGAWRTHIVGQFVTQSTLIAAGALVLAYALMPFIPLPVDIQRELANVSTDPELIGWFLLFSLFTGLLAGGFPAWMLSSLKPATVLRNLKSLELMEGLTLRKVLVTGQFAISIVLLITATVVYQQSQWAATTDYGFHQQNIVNLNLQGEVDPQVMMDELASIPGVERISSISSPFGFFSSPEDFRLSREGEPIHGDYYSVDRNVVPNLELSLAAGRNFTEEMAQSPGSHALINEQFLEITEWERPAEAIGKTIWWRDYELRIAGVVENFNYKTLSMPIRPIILHHAPRETNYLNIRLAAGATDSVVRQMEEAWVQHAPLVPVDYHEYDRAIYESMSQEQEVASLGYYALIALSIACLGLLGMVTYTVEVRTQEVGIRKVLGAGIAGIVRLLSREFVLLLGIAALIGLPIGYWMGQQFLNSYAYHISIGFWSLFGGLLVMGSFGLLAIGWQTWQVARKNPVEAIRTE